MSKANGTHNLTSSQAAPSYWQTVAARYNQIGPPLVPPPSVAAQMAALSAPIGGDALVLGATPSFATLPGRMTACDLQRDVLNALWPQGDPRLQSCVTDWRNLPFADHSIHRIYADGALVSLPSRGIAEAVLRECRRVLSPGGIMVQRLFVQPLSSLDALGLLDTLGPQSSLTALRLRLMCASGQAPDYLVRPGRIAALLEQKFGTIDAALDHFGLPASGSDVLDAARRSDLTYFVAPSLAFAELARQVGFSVTEHPTSGYDAAELCPIQVLT